MILGYDLQAGRVSLGLKQVKENPWDSIEKKYQSGNRIIRKIVKVTNSGAFIELEDGIDGFLHIDDISWSRKAKGQSGLTVGQEIEVVVLSVDSGARNIKLGVKQLSEDPWKDFCENNKPGSSVEGEIVSITDFGIFLRVTGGIEGLIHKSNLTENREEDIEEALKKYKVGDKLKATVLEIQSDKQKAAFTLREVSNYAPTKKINKEAGKDDISKYMAKEESSDSTYTLGAALKSKVNE
jgi:small subunit ribosomal protein S1